MQGIDADLALLPYILREDLGERPGPARRLLAGGMVAAAALLIVPMGTAPVTAPRPDAATILEARLLPFDGTLLFSGAFLYHPREARKPILAEVKRLKKAAGKGNLPDVSALLARLARMAMKLERYRNVRLESIYDFSPEQPHAATPRPPAKTG